MIALVSVLIGPPNAGKTGQLLDRYRRVLKGPLSGAAIDRALWLAPTARAASVVRWRMLVGLDACLGPAVLTFDQLTDRVLAAAGSSRRTLAPSMQRALLTRLVGWAVENGLLQALGQSAARPGFIDLLADHVRELERRGLAPEIYAQAAARSHSNRHKELSLLYTEYERRLEAGSLIDNEGCYWTAVDLLAAKTCPWPRDLEVVVADGFADFTPVQHRILQALGQRASHVLISLPGEAEAEEPVSPFGVTGRAELFAKSQAALAELRRHHARVEVLRLPRRSSGWAALDHWRDHLFRNPRQVPRPSAAAAESLDRVEIIAAASAHDEIVQVARRIKRALASGRARPGDMVVVFRSLGDVARRVREVFTEFGIPHYLESGQPLLASGFMRTLLSVLRLDLEDWPYRRVVSVITNQMLTVWDDEARGATDWLVRDLQVAEGRRALMDRVRQLAGDAAAAQPINESTAGQREPPHQRRTSAATAALPVLQQLTSALDDLPHAATYAEWANALMRLTETLGFAPRSAERALPAIADVNHQLTLDLATGDDRLAWERVTQTLTSLERLARWLGEPAPRLSRSEILRALIDVATHESLLPPHDEVGRVRILSATTARTVTAKHFFLAGMSEQAFPSPDRVGRLATDADYRFFANVVDGRSAVDAPSPVERSQEEMLLFYELVTRPTERLTISYPALDERAQVLPPSPYVTEVQRIFHPEPIDHVAPQLSPVPADPLPFGPADRRVMAISAAMNDKRQLLAGMLAEGTSLAGAIDAGLRIVQSRSDRHAFSAAEGLLTSQAVRDRLAQRFGPQHLWSPSQWERYAACPYCFFLHDVLGLQPLGDLTLETDFARRGSLLHRVLAAFHRHLRDELGDVQVTSQGDQSRFQAAFKAAVAAALAATSSSGLDAALLELDRRQIERWGDGYYGQYASYDERWSVLDRPPAPMHFEVRFGPPQPGEDGAEDPRSTSLPFVLEVGDERIQIVGRIDRIDVGTVGGRTVFNVIDYKSGSKPSLKAEHIESGERLQLPLYVMAAQHLLFSDDGGAPLSAGYWTMKDGFRGSLDVHQCAAGDIEPTDGWQSLEPKVIERVAEFVHAIRRGDFPVCSRDDKCTSRCEYRTVCRVAQVRSLGKTWSPNEETGEP